MKENEKDSLSVEERAVLLISRADELLERDIEKALDIYAKALPLYAMLLENATAEEREKFALTAARAYVKGAKANIRYGDEETATGYLERATGIYSGISGEAYSKEYAEALFLLVGAGMTVRSAPYVRDIYEKAVAVIERLYEKEGEKYALLLALLYEKGVALLNKERNTDGEEMKRLAEKTVALKGDLEGKGAKAYHLLAVAYSTLGESMRGVAGGALSASEYFVNAAAYGEKAAEENAIYSRSPELGGYYSRAGYCLCVCGKESEGYAYLLKALAVFADAIARGELYDFDDCIRAAKYVSGAECSPEDGAEDVYEQAQTLCKECVSAAEKLYEISDSYVALYAKATCVPGELYMESNEYEKASEALEPGFSAIGKAYADDPGTYARDYSFVATRAGLAKICCNSFGEAETRLLSALEACERDEDDGEERADMHAYIVYSLANLYGEMKDYSRAEERYIQSVNELEELFGKYGAKYAGRLATSKYFLADVYETTGRYAEAASCLSEATGILEAMGESVKPAKIALYYFKLSDLEKALGNGEKAEKCTEKAEEYMKKSSFYIQR